MPYFQLDQIAERYLGGQTPREFVENGGDPETYARLVFNRQIFGPHEAPDAPEIGIEDEDDLAEALSILIGREKRLQALDHHRSGTQFQSLDPSSPTVTAQIRFPKPLLDRIDSAARAAGVSRSEWLRQLAEAALA